MKIGKSIFNIFLAFCIVIFSCGVTVGKMVCLSSGEVTIELFNVEDCCAEEGSEAPVEEECCDISNSTLALNAFTFTKYSPDLSLSFSSSVVPPEIFSFNLQKQTSLLLLPVDHPPPLSGKSLLYLIQILII